MHAQMLLYKQLLRSGVLRSRQLKAEQYAAEALFGIVLCMHNSIESPFAGQRAFEEPLHKASVKVVASQLRITFKQQHNVGSQQNIYGQLNKVRQSLCTFKMGWTAHCVEGSKCGLETSD